MKATFLTVGHSYENVRMSREFNALCAAGWDCKGIIDDTKYPPLGLFPARALTFWKGSKRLARRVAETKPDIIVAHDIYTLLAGKFAHDMTNAPLIYDCHDDWPAVHRKNSILESIITRMLENWLLRSVARVLTVSPSLADRFGVSTVLYNARAKNDIMVGRRGTARQQYGLDDDDFVLGWIGKLTDADIDRVVKAMTLMPKNVMLLVVGGHDEELLKLDNLAMRYGVWNRLRLYGRFPYEKIADYYAAIDAGLVLYGNKPHLTCMLPNKFFDFTARSIPVIVPDHAVDMAQLTRAKRCGWVVPCWSYSRGKEIFAAMVDGLSQKPALVREYGANGRRAFLQEWCWDVQKEKFLTAIEDIYENHTSTD